MVFALIYPAVIALADYFTEGLFVRKTFFKSAFISFSAGVSVVYLLMQLLPEVYYGAFKINKIIIVFVLFGFILHHLIEKYIYQHVPRRDLIRDLRKEHVFALFLYHFISGMVLVDLLQRDTTQGILFFIPITFHIVIDNLPKKVVHGSWMVKVFFSGSILMGGILAFYTKFSDFVDFALLGFIGGIILYFIVREAIPQGKKGRPFFFILGVLIYMLVIMGLGNYGTFTI